MDKHAGLPTSYFDASTSSFSDFLKMNSPDLLPSAPLVDIARHDNGSPLAPHGTTIVATKFIDGVLLAGDRRATMGHVIAQRDIDKILAADKYTGVGVAGSAGIAIDLVRLFQVELEHYEKIEGTALSIEGKANRLGTLLRGNLGLAMQGLAAVPLMAGFDRLNSKGRIFSYDVTGGRYEEHEYYSIGSGAYFASGSLKKLHDSGQSRAEAIEVSLQALYDAADDDSATGGPDLTRGIFPLVALITENGFELVDDEVLAAAVTRMMSDRMERPDGPRAMIGGE